MESPVQANLTRKNGDKAIAKDSHGEGAAEQLWRALEARLGGRAAGWAASHSWHRGWAPGPGPWAGPDQSRIITRTVVNKGGGSCSHILTGLDQLLLCFGTFLYEK